MQQEESEDEDTRKIVRLLQWFGDQGFEINNVAVLHPQGAGRGLGFSYDITAASYLLRIPENFLITTETVINSWLKPVIRDHPGIVTPFDALCLFLMSEYCRKRSSFWWPFIDTLPAVKQASGMLLSLSDDEQCQFCNLLPLQFREMYVEQRRNIDNSRLRVISVWKDIKQHLQLPIDISSDELFYWSWACVNTRCVFKENLVTVPYLNIDGDDTICLVPLLDMLNHSARARIEAKFSKINRTYDVWTDDGVIHGSEAFICYGPHSNGRLFIEYGFVLHENPNNAVYFKHDTLRQLCTKLDMNVQEENWTALVQSQLPCCLYQTSAEPPWTFLATFYILALPKTEIKFWRKVFEHQSITDCSVIQFAISTLQLYLNQLQDLKPDETTMKAVPHHFVTMIDQMWEDERNIICDCIAHLNEVLTADDESDS